MLFLGHFDTQSWTAEGEADAYSSEIKIGFRNGTDETVYFDNLSFGYSVFDGDQEIFTASLPEENVVYKSSDQAYIAGDVVNELSPEKSYTVKVWAENAGQRFEDTLEFTTPRPPKPFESWTYDSENKIWLAPSPYPTDGQDYTWNEETLSWDPYPVVES